MNTNRYQLKITLERVRPAIWRRLQVPGAATLALLHDVIQIAFGWTDSHLHEFYVNKRRYGVPHEMNEDLLDESTVTLQEAVGQRLKRFQYNYDFGDDWVHEVRVEKVLEGDAASPEISCLAGSRQCPPEDCGGPFGYAEFLEAIGNPKHPEHEEMLDWVGGAFDPEAFDLSAVNQTLAKLRVRKGRARGAAS